MVYRTPSLRSPARLSEVILKMLMRTIVGVFFLAVGVYSYTLLAGDKEDVASQGYWTQASIEKQDQGLWNDVLTRFDEDPCESLSFLNSGLSRSNNETLLKLIDFLISTIEDSGCKGAIEIPEPVLIFKPKAIFQDDSGTGESADASVVLMTVTVTEKGLVRESRIVKRIAGEAEIDHLYYEYARNMVFVPARIEGRFVECPFRILVKTSLR